MNHMKSMIIILLFTMMRRAVLRRFPLFSSPLVRSRCMSYSPSSAQDIAPTVAEVQGTFIPAEIDPIADSHHVLRSAFQKKNYVRLDKLLSNLGITTRRNSVSFIKKNNITVAIGEDEFQEFDHQKNALVTKRKEVIKRVPYSTIVYPPAVRFNNEPLEFVKKLCIVMHKPRGYVCSHTRDEPESKIVFDLLPKQILSLKPKLSIAGRLDKWASGLLILSQDGKLISKIIQQNVHKKQYTVELKHDAKGNEPELFASGDLTLRSEKKACLPASLEILEPRKVQITLQEGKYHQIRRMIAAAGNLSLGVHRDKIGDISLDGLLPGTYRDLTNAELQHLWTNTPLEKCSDDYVHEAPRQKKKRHLRKRFPDTEPKKEDKKQKK
uniref:Pseudouridine synthase RsuA/RluA-like domain-containing protein n=1 Tax=Vannella robusta TaxID=1487602 RepID=A0A7S4MSR8_9EUKA